MELGCWVAEVLLKYFSSKETTDTGQLVTAAQDEAHTISNGEIMTPSLFFYQRHWEGIPVTHHLEQKNHSAVSGSTQSASWKLVLKKKCRNSLDDLGKVGLVLE